MNHLLDDLLLNAAVPGRRRSAIFRNMYPGAPADPRVLRAWRKLASDPARLESASRTVVDDLRSLYDRNRPRLMVMNHYRSWFHSHNGLSGVDESLAPLISGLARCLHAANEGAGAPGGPSWLVLPPAPWIPSC